MVQLPRLRHALARCTPTSRPLLRGRTLRSTTSSSISSRRVASRGKLCRRQVSPGVLEFAAPVQSCRLQSRHAVLHRSTALASLRSTMTLRGQEVPPSPRTENLERAARVLYHQCSPLAQPCTCRQRRSRLLRRSRDRDRDRDRRRPEDEDDELEPPLRSRAPPSPAVRRRASRFACRESLRARFTSFLARFAAARSDSSGRVAACSPGGKPGGRGTPAPPAAAAAAMTAARRALSTASARASASASASVPALLPDTPPPPLPPAACGSPAPHAYGSSPRSPTCSRTAPSGTLTLGGGGMRAASSVGAAAPTTPPSFSTSLRRSL